MGTTMRDVITTVQEWMDDGKVFALATVVNIQKSAPRGAGAAMIVGEDGEVLGSVSGGCVEGAVYESAQQVLKDGKPVLERFGYGDSDAFAAGLTCGGIIDIYVERVPRDSFPQMSRFLSDISVGRPVALVTVVEHKDAHHIGKRLVVRPNEVEGTLGNSRADDAVAIDARAFLAAGEASLITYGPGGERMEAGMKVFISSFQPSPRMIVFGAIDFAAALARAGAMVGFHVTVCDARMVFATQARFPAADQVVVAWPHTYLKQQLREGKIDNRTVICVLTHDPKFDVPVLDMALRLSGDTKPAYIGAMGSRSTHEDRLGRLGEKGLNSFQISELHSPIGLDLGGRTPEETAISIVAEIIAERYGGSGQPLRRSPHETVHPDAHSLSREG
jgi:xanthine dehydrogenase accessory factor